MDARADDSHEELGDFPPLRAEQGLVIQEIVLL